MRIHVLITNPTLNNEEGQSPFIRAHFYANLDDTPFPDADLTVPKANEVKSFKLLILKRVMKRILSIKRPIFKVLPTVPKRNLFGTV